jgi:hypothetical protein
MMKGYYQKSKVPLLNEEGSDINDRATSIFTELFDMFAVEDPDFEGKKIMTDVQVAEYIRKATKEPCLPTDMRVLKFFDYDKDKDGKLVCEDFIAFYR